MPGALRWGNVWRWHADVEEGSATQPPREAVGEDDDDLGDLINDDLDASEDASSSLGHSEPGLESEK